MSTYHKTLSQEKWNAYPIHQQLLMIGSEFSRILNLDDDQLRKECIERAIELLDLAANDVQYLSHKEIARLRELLGRHYVGPIDLKQIEDFYEYCLTFVR